jgi:hypothetical protein
MLLSQHDTRVALDELEAATAGMEDSAVMPAGSGEALVARSTDADRVAWDALEDRFERAYRGFEDAIRIELGSEALGAHPPQRQTSRPIAAEKESRLPWRR